MKTKSITKSELMEKLIAYGGSMAGGYSKHQRPGQRRQRWHIHPNASDPQLGSILSFDTLSELDEWIDENQIMKDEARERYEEGRRQWEQENQ